VITIVRRHQLVPSAAEAGMCGMCPPAEACLEQAALNLNMLIEPKKMRNGCNTKTARRYIYCYSLQNQETPAPKTHL
jgi:hypothetical protein